MEITTDLVKHLASLSRLNFNESELESFKADFQSIVNYVETLSKTDTSDVELKNNKLNAEQELRADEIKPSLKTEAILENAPSKQRNMLVVPNIKE